jgi:GNAT superfamily N-acetyltransferase
MISSEWRYGMSKIEIRQASIADISIIESILLDTVTWLNEIEQPLWGAKEVVWDSLVKSYRIEDFRIAFCEGEPAGCMVLVDYDPFFWPDTAKGEALMIHKLAVTKSARKSGVADALMDFAKVEGTRRRVASIRLDCHQYRPKLRAFYERHGFVCVGEKTFNGKWFTSFYVHELHHYLYHYFERRYGPFRPLTALPMEEARQILMERRSAGHFGNPDVEGFLHKRYERDKKLRDCFIAHGGKPVRTSPVYMMLGEHKQWESAYDQPEAIKIPLDEFDPLTVSFTYGDSFAIFDPTLSGEEEYWNKLYFVDEILAVISRHGFPAYVAYDFKRGIYPKDKHINHYLKYVEAHIWSDDVLNKYREIWLEEIRSDDQR